jgi:hypothetical protein
LIAAVEAGNVVRAARDRQPNGPRRSDPPTRPA